MLNGAETLSLINAGCFDEFNINRKSLRLSLVSVRNYGEILQGILDKDVVDAPSINIVNDDIPI